MKSIEALDQIQSAWLIKLSQRLARGEEVRENFIDLLNQFFSKLRQAVVTGDSTWLDPLLDDWMNSLTQSDLEDKKISITPIIHEMQLLTSETAKENLFDLEALNLILTILPIFVHASEYVTQQEVSLHVDHITQKLEKTSSTLEHLDRSKSDFIAIAAHELKTPLTLIEGYSDMLHEQVRDYGENGQIQLLISGINNGARRLREIISDMIDVSLIDNKLLSLHFQPFWLNRLLAVILREFENSIQERKQSVQVHSFPGIEELNFGDEERLFQAFRNLISNAIKYTPDGGKITIEGRKLPGFIEVIISDTGIGIDPKDQANIFEKFGRVGNITLHSSSKTKYKGGGPGLGLPITKGIIEAHGGTIWVESPGYDEVDCPGSTFHVILPLYTSPPDDRTAKLFSRFVHSGSDADQSRVV